MQRGVGGAALPFTEGEDRMYRSSYRVGTWITASLAVLLAVPTLAQAQSSKPTVVTSSAAQIAPQSARLVGKITPNGAQTSYRFEYGTTMFYVSNTTPAIAGSGNTAATVAADLTGLAPATVYHFRLVARNRNGTVNGADRTFKTSSVPLGLTFAVTRNPVPFGQSTVLNGTLTGTGSANRQILLQSTPFPYTQPFQPTTNVQLTNPQGQFSFPLLSVGINTQYRVVIPGRPEVASPILSLGVAVRVATYTSTRHVRTGRIVRFFGTVRPARPGARFAIQRRRHGSWHTVSGGETHGSGGGVSRYSKRLRIRRGGLYRVFVQIADGSLASKAGRTVRIKPVS
jgi:hypothetical protein